MASEHGSVTAPFAGVVVSIARSADRARGRRQRAVVVLEAMKMEHEVLAEIDGIVLEAGRRGR